MVLGCFDYPLNLHRTDMECCAQLTYSPSTVENQYETLTATMLGCSNKRKLSDTDCNEPRSKISSTRNDILDNRKSFSMTGQRSSQTNKARNYDVKTVKRQAQTKKKKIDMTLDWLEKNYVICDGVCLARCILYSHYLDFCNKSNIEPACAATFGKTIRHKFPLLTTRRLGTRGHSKYHYYGIGIRETSIYYNSVFAGKGLTRFSPALKHETESSADGVGQYPRNCMRRFLDEFPDASQFSETGEIPRETVQDFLSYYKGYCERIINAAGTRSFDLIPSIHLGCWEGFASQYLGILNNVVIIDLIALCDILLHESLTDLLLPAACNNMTEIELLEVRNVGKQWEGWVKASLVGCPEQLSVKKSLIAQQFGQSLVRQTSFVNLSRTVRAIMEDRATVTPMLRDIENIDLKSMGSQAFYANTESEDQDTDLNSELIKELKDLLNKRANVDMFVEWLDNVVDQKVIKPSKQNGRSMKKRAQDFLLKWSFFGARVMHTLTINNAVSFNSFHYLRMLMDEYILFAVETQFNNEKRQEFRNLVAKHIKHTKSPSTSNAVLTYPTTSPIYPDEGLRGRKAWEQPWPSEAYSSNMPLGYTSVDVTTKSSLPTALKENDSYYTTDTQGQDYAADYSVMPYASEYGMYSYNMQPRPYVNLF
nr:DNA-binding protein RFX6-like [Ciona intestinalis]|eukprot:XP_026695891.1 DNA-binding protein RFX6-like [Ciona intestinalis]